MLYERVARPALFRLGHGDPEVAHEWTLGRLAALSPRTRDALRRAYFVPAPRTAFGIRFANPVGLAAGMDKDGVALAAWPALGFGFVEAGTVTWHAQPGNERPRLFRLRSSEAIINRMGFNNKGARALAQRLEASGPPAVPLGISLGKSKATRLEDAVGDYLASFRALYPYGDYFAVNVSSPNTPGLRSLQGRAQLSELLGALHAEAVGLAAASGSTHPPATSGAGPPASPKPILVKIAPDLTDAAIAEALQVCLDHGIGGVIATNTTLQRIGLAPTDIMRGGQAGGLSGRPLAARAREVVAFAYRETGGHLPIIGVGGILEPDDAVRLVDAGASLVQLYTGLIYRGPGLVRRTVKALRT